MAKQNNQRLKILRIWDILRTESDEDKPMTTNELIDRLQDEGIPADRKTIYSDIALLNENGYEIMTSRGKGNGYYVIDRPFDAAELKILVDAVRSAKFITEKKSKALIDKLAEQAGDYRADILKKGVFFDVVKLRNEEIFYNVNCVNEAIQRGVKISFLYFELDTKRRKNYRRNGERYLISPIATVFNDGYYYLIGYTDKYESTVNFRIDRMEKARMEKEPISEAAKLKDVKGIQKQQFAMFRGNRRHVEMTVGKSVVEPLIDKFGTAVLFDPLGEDKFKVTVTVEVSPTFFGWCFIFGDQLQITAPEAVREQYEQTLLAAAKLNGGN